MNLSPTEEPGFDKIFTLEEARASLPIIVPLLMEVRHRQQDMMGMIESKGRLADGNGRAYRDKQEHLDDLNRMSHDAESIQELVGRIHETGALVKDLTLGLVDFPHRREGRLVFLCWKLGEQEILFWHEMDAGVAGRRPI